MKSLIQSTWRKSLPHLLFLIFGSISSAAVSLVGTWLQSTAQALLVYKLSGGQSEPVAITACCTAGPLLLFGPTMGGLTSHMHQRRVVILTQIFELVLAAVLGVLVYTGTATLSLVYLLAFLLGCAEAIYFPSAQSFLREIAGTS